MRVFLMSSLMLMLVMLVRVEVVEGQGICTCFKRIGQGVRIVKDECEVIKQMNLYPNLFGQIRIRIQTYGAGSVPGSKGKN
jgi:hypothetical protein